MTPAPQQTLSNAAPQQYAVMDQLRQQHESPQKIDFNEIIKTAVEKEYPGGDWRAVRGAMSILDNSNKGRVIRAGNTLLMYVIKGKGVVDFVILNADPVNFFVQNIQELMAAVKKAGIKELRGTTTNSETIQALQQAGIDVQGKMSQHMDAKGAKPAISMIVRA